jgi:excisionase family DNA binding protein
MAAEQRFLTLADVAEVLNISASQVYALVRNEELPAIKIGGRGQWRVERDKLEEYIARMYEQTRQFIASHPFADPDDASDDAAHESDRVQRN